MAVSADNRSNLISSMQHLADKKIEEQMAKIGITYERDPMGPTGDAGSGKIVSFAARKCKLDFCPYDIFCTEESVDYEKTIDEGKKHEVPNFDVSPGKHSNKTDMVDNFEFFDLNEGSSQNVFGRDQAYDDFSLQNILGDCKTPKPSSVYNFQLC
jgi:hypothetical protein